MNLLLSCLRGVDNNYNEDTTTDDSQSELTKLRLENQTLQLLLREHLNKSTIQNDENDTESSSTQQVMPSKNKTNPPIHVTLT